MVVIESFDDGGGVGSFGRAQESLCVAGAGGAQGELDAARGFGVVVAVDISGFQLSGQVALGQDAPGSGREWREPFPGGARGPPVEVGRGVLSLARSVCTCPSPAFWAGPSLEGAGRGSAAPALRAPSEK